MNRYKASRWRTLSSLAFPTGAVPINYNYDKLNRLTSATYSSGMTYAYSYDAVGNRKSQTLTINGTAATTLYNYDAANRLSSVGGVTYTYDGNGNLLSDSTNTYAHDAANRLTGVSNQTSVTSYAYNGLGDRLQETIGVLTTRFTTDLAAGLSQTISDGVNNYTYGLGRIAQTNATSTEYFLGDALGSVRQLADSSGTVTLTRTYDPYGVVTTSNGAGRTSYGYTSEFQGDYSELVYLRARQYSPATGRFLTRDTWGGDANRPGSFNRWSYVEANPIRYSDPTGLCSTCFVFYFAGAGNRGDIDKDYNLFNDLSIGERTLLNKLTPYATVKVIYPYENGIRSTSKIEEVLKDFPKGIPIFNGLSKVIPAALGLNSLGSSKANQTWEDLLGYCPSQDVVVDNSQIKITLIGYSGGSQVAYSTAQELSSRLFIDNLVEIAPTYRAYNQMANIENIWELVGENDDIVDLADSLWHNYNSGYRVEYHDNSYLYGSYETVYDESLDIYKHGANRCNMLNVLGKPYGHSGTGDYFDFNTPTSGTVCNGVKIPNVTTSSRGQAVVDMLVNVIGIGQ